MSCRNWSSWLVGMICLVAVVSPMITSAQETASVQAIAVVLPSMSVIGTNNLNFEYVMPGVNKTINKTTIGYAGEWQITGSSAAEIILDFSLPDSIYLVGGISAMRIGFNSIDASYENGLGLGQLTPAGILNPHGINVRNLGTDGTMAVWIGGTVFPRRSQTSGSYRGDIILTVTYTGN